MAVARQMVACLLTCVLSFAAASFRFLEMVFLHVVGMTLHRAKGMPITKSVEIAAACNAALHREEDILLRRGGSSALHWEGSSASLSGLRYRAVVNSWGRFGIDARGSFWQDGLSRICHRNHCVQIQRSGGWRSRVMPIGIRGIIAIALVHVSMLVLPLSVWGAASVTADNSEQESGVQDSELEKLKKQFADLMAERAGLHKQAQESTRVIQDSRRKAQSSGNKGEGLEYRKALKRVADAVESHPRMKELKLQYDEIQQEKVAFAKEKSDFLRERRQSKKTQDDKYAHQLSEVNKQFRQERSALLKRAGVKAIDELGESEQKEYQQIYSRLTNEIAQAKSARAQGMEEIEQADEGDDGYKAKLEELNAGYKDFEQRQAELKVQMEVLRSSLRRNDPEIVKLQDEARKSSREFIKKNEAKPEVKEAREFLRRVNMLRASIDKQARVLRQAILAEDPECKEELDRQATAGGLALVGEDFWKITQ